MRDLLAASSVNATAATVSVPSLMLQLLIGLAVVIGLIWVASKVAKGRLARPARSRGASTALSVISRQTLGKGVHVAVVRIGSETLLLGVTAHQVTRLAEIASDDAVSIADDQVAASFRPRQLTAGQLPSLRPMQGVFRYLQELTTRRA